MTQVVLLKNPGQASYTYEHLAAVFPPPPTAAEGVTPPDGIVYSTNTFGLDDKVADGRERYMLRTIGACLIEFVGETGKAPTARELFDLAWPQYERNVDFSRPGRGADEFAAKCAYSVARFNASKIRGCETIEKTAELYRQRQQARTGQEEQARRAEAAANPTDPVDLWGWFDPPPLPRGLLPQMIEDFAFDRGRILGGDAAGIAVGALAVCGAAIPDRICLRPKKHDEGWHEAARLWVALVGLPSTMKSPIMSTVAFPLRAIDAEMAQKNQRAMAEYNRLSREEKQEREPPEQTRLAMQDTTIEAAQEILKDSPDGVLLYQDELSGWFGSMEKYSSARGAAKDRAFWLQSWNGGLYAVNRIGRGSLLIPNLSVSILGGIQPDIIRKFAEDSHDDGLLQRLIPIMLRPAVAGRDEKPSRSVAEYKSLVGRLHHIGSPSWAEACSRAARSCILTTAPSPSARSLRKGTSNSRSAKASTGNWRRTSASTTAYLPGSASSGIASSTPGEISPPPSPKPLHGASRAFCTASCCRTRWLSMPEPWGFLTTMTGWPPLRATSLPTSWSASPTATFSAATEACAS